MVCAEGYFICVEWKAKTGKPRKTQIRKLNEVQQAGGFGFVTRSADHAVHTIERYIKERTRMAEGFDIDAFLAEIEQENERIGASAATATAEGESIEPDDGPGLTVDDMAAITAPDVPITAHPPATTPRRGRRPKDAAVEPPVTVVESTDGSTALIQALMRNVQTMEKLIAKIDAFIAAREK